MPRSSFGFDGDNAYHEQLKAKVLADREKAREEAILKIAQEHEAEKERRRSLGLPEELPEKKGFWRRKSSTGGGSKDLLKEVKKKEDGEGFGEKMINLVFDAGRSKKKDMV